MPDDQQPLASQFLPGTSKVDFPTPLPDDKLLTDFIANNAADYLAVIAGTPHQDFTKYPDHRLVAQVPINWRLAQRIYASDRATAEDTYNASISFSDEAKDYPIFVRDYLVRRSAEPAARRTRLSTLTGVINAVVTAGGQNYSSATIVSATGGAGTGFEATALISNGVVVGIAITDEGSGYTSAPTLSITDTGGGSGATATASIQPTTALLVKEDVLRQPDSPTDSLYVVVRRVYETLPGPLRSGQMFDRRIGLISEFTKQKTAAGSSLGDPFTEIEPLSSVKDEVTVWDAAAIQTQLDALHTIAATNVRNLGLPDVLTGITVVYNTGTGVGEHETNPEGASTGTSWSLSLNDNSRSQGSASIVPELIINRQTWANTELPGENHIFYAADNSSRASIISRLSSLMGRAVTSIVAGVVTTSPAADGTVGHGLALNQIFQFSSLVSASGGVATLTNYYVKTIPASNTFTYAATSGGSALSGHAATSGVTIIPINEMPVWRPKPHIIAGTGQHVSVSADANVQQHVSSGNSNTTLTYSEGDGTSQEVTGSNQSWQIPPTIHPEIKIKNVDTSDATSPVTASAAATASAGWAAGTNWPARAASASASKTASATLTPLTLAATAQTAWPTQGLYISAFSAPELYGFSRSLVFIQLVDFALVIP